MFVALVAGLSHAGPARLQNHAIEKRPSICSCDRDVLADFSPPRWTRNRTLAGAVEKAPSWCTASKPRFGAPWLTWSARIGPCAGAGRVVANLDRGSVSICDDGPESLQAPNHRAVPNRNPKRLWTWPVDLDHEERCAHPGCAGRCFRSFGSEAAVQREFRPSVPYLERSTAKSIALFGCGWNG